jgi:hypothetical protein
MALFVNHGNLEGWSGSPEPGGRFGEILSTYYRVFPGDAPAEIIY